MDVSVTSKDVGDQTVVDVSPGKYAEKPQLLSGAAGVVSSARDYVRFGQMLLGRGQLGSVRIMKEQTAATMMSNLLEKGVPQSQLDGPRGFGESQPIDTNDTAAGRQRNRRTELKVEQ